LDAIGFDTSNVDNATIADALEAMLALLDLQSDMMEKLVDELNVSHEKHEQYFAEINNYCVEIEQDLFQAEQDIKDLKKKKECSCGSCDIVSETMRNLQW
jgi:septal ring factor EnvC (AmiA/AmiB activator)